MRSFTHEQPGIRVIFGCGTFDRLAEEVQRLGAHRAMIVTSSRRHEDADEAARRLGNAAAGIFAEAVMHVPIEIARAACEAAKRYDADCCVVMGGGSTIGLGKAVARETGLPIVAIPTTYAGSEMTPIYGYTENGAKKTGRDPRVLPKTVIYDPLLTMKVPPGVAGPSGMNALAHCMAGVLDEQASPLVKLHASEAIRTLFRALPEVVDNPADLDARSDALYAGWLAGSVLGVVRLNIHYRICHVLGGTFNLPHAEVHTVVLPQSVAYNTGSARDGQQIYDLAERIGAPMALKDIGMMESGLDRAAQLAVENVAYNPRPVDYSAVRKMLGDAYHGLRPTFSESA
jgi:maleylacetate reductase